MFKTGDVVRVVSNSNAHGYKIGSVVTLGQRWPGLDSFTFHGGGSTAPWLSIDDIELVHKGRANSPSRGFSAFQRKISA